MPSLITRYQRWQCDLCRASSTVACDPNEDAGDIAMRVEEQHATMSPHCYGSVRNCTLRYMSSWSGPDSASAAATTAQ